MSELLGSDFRIYVISVGEAGTEFSKRETYLIAAKKSECVALHDPLDLFMKVVEAIDVTVPSIIFIGLLFYY